MERNHFSVIAFSLILVLLIQGQSIYQYSVKSIHGPNRPLHAYSGRKMLFITLPVNRSPSADSLLRSIDSLGDAYEGVVKIIAVPSIEDGFTVAQRPQLRQWYRDFLDSSILITDGMRTRKSSGSQQHPLFKWLTKVEKNQHFNEDVNGPRMKFLVRASGELYAVFRARTKLSSQTLHMALQAP